MGAGDGGWGWGYASGRGVGAATGELDSPPRPAWFGECKPQALLGGVFLFIIWCWMLWGWLALTVGVWLWVNYGGYGASLRYQLPQPVTHPPKPTGTEVPEPQDHEYGAARQNHVVAGGAGSGGGVVILSPGRDEAAQLPTVLPGLCEQDYADLRVVFIDDASSDDTPAITAAMAARYPQLMVVRNEQEPPPGWMGKCWAIHCGYEALQAKILEQKSEIDWLCFTDADIHWHPQLLRTAIDHALEHDADLLGVTPTLRFGSVSEAVVQLQLVLALGLMLPFEKAMDPDSPFALTGGAFILVRKKFYDAIGGHTAVKGEMVEDLKLGMALKAAGARHRVAMAGELQTCRMYDGWADMWEGLTKNAYAGVNHRWWLALPMCLMVLLLNVLPAAALPAAALWWLAAPGWVPAAVTLCLALVVGLQARALNTARKLMHLPWGYAWSMPIGSAVYLAIILTSIGQYHTKGNAWKGRRYAASDSPKT